MEKVQAIQFKVANCQAVVPEIRNMTSDNKINREQQLTTFEFIVSLTVWYDLLSKIKSVSKILQNLNMHVDYAIVHLEVVLSSEEREVPGKHFIWSNLNKLYIN